MRTYSRPPSAFGILITDTLATTRNDKVNFYSRVKQDKKSSSCGHCLLGMVQSLFLYSSSFSLLNRDVQRAPRRPKPLSCSVHTGYWDLGFQTPLKYLYSNRVLVLLSSLVSLSLSPPAPTPTPSYIFILENAGQKGTLLLEQKVVRFVTVWGRRMTTNSAT